MRASGRSPNPRPCRSSSLPSRTRLACRQLEVTRCPASMPRSSRPRWPYSRASSFLRSSRHRARRCPGRAGSRRDQGVERDRRRGRSPTENATPVPASPLYFAFTSIAMHDAVATIEGGLRAVHRTAARPRTRLARRGGGDGGPPRAEALLPRIGSEPRRRLRRIPRRRAERRRQGARHPRRPTPPRMRSSPCAPTTAAETAHPSSRPSRASASGDRLRSRAPAHGGARGSASSIRS